MFSVWQDPNTSTVAMTITRSWFVSLSGRSFTITQLPSLSHAPSRCRRLGDTGCLCAVGERQDTTHGQQGLLQDNERSSTQRITILLSIQACYRPLTHRVLRPDKDSDHLTPNKTIKNLPLNEVLKNIFSCLCYVTALAVFYRYLRYNYISVQYVQ